MSTLAPLESIRFCILLALAKRPDHGYGLQAQITRDAEDLVMIDRSTIYKALKRLEAEGDIVRDPRSDARVTIYQLAPRGRRTLKIEADRLSRAVRLMEERFK